MRTEGTAGSGRTRTIPGSIPPCCPVPGTSPHATASRSTGRSGLAEAGGGRKVHLLAVVTHVPGLVIAQDRVAKAGKVFSDTQNSDEIGLWRH